MHPLDLIRQFENCARLDIRTELHFGSNNPDHRQVIRQDIVQKYKNDLSYSEQQKILDLQHWPVSEKIFFSVSHCAVLGGYAACSEPVGFDIEDPVRLKPEIIKRVCTTEEIAGAHDYRILWTMKEAALKALHSKDLLITDIQIVQIQSQNETGLSTYRAHSHKALDLKKNMGYFFQKNGLFFSIFFK